MRRHLLEFLRDQDGIDAVEYGILLAVIFLIIIGAVTLMATNATSMFTKIAGNV